jgi:protease I
MAAKKILMITGDFTEDYETMVPFQALLMVGHTVHAVCPGKKAGEQVRTAVHDFEGDQTYSEKPGHNFTLNAEFADIRAGRLRRAGHPRWPRPGIPAPEPRGDRDAVQHFADAKQADRRHLPRRPAADAAGVLSGRSCSAYPACGPEVTAAGGSYADIPVDQATCRRQSGHRPGLAGPPGLAGQVPEGARHPNRRLIP